MVAGSAWWYCNTCRFRKVSVLAAQAHADRTGHTLHRGDKTVRPRQPLVKLGGEAIVRVQGRSP
jgi:hypothetical protein